MVGGSEWQNARLKDLTWFLARISLPESQTVTSWSAFNEVSSDVNPEVTTMGVLPILQAHAEDKDPVTTVLHCFQNISKQLGQCCTVVFGDQPLYSKAKELMWANPDDFQNVGHLHIAFNFLKTLAQHVENSELDDVLVKSGVYAPNNTKAMMDVKPITEQLGDTHWHMKLSED